VSRFEVDLALSQRMAEAARRSASTAGALVSVAIVDAGGHLLAFERMDGAEIAGPVLARDKAFTAVAHRVATHDLTALVQPGAELAGMNSADGGRYIAFGGGLPLWDADRVVGGVGVSGGTCDQDIAAATAALDVFSAALTA
jgi:uncharacterized protein GlcG (DUF336 family)